MEKNTQQPSGDPITDLRAAIGLAAGAQPFQRRRALESLIAASARLLSSLIPARDRLRVGLADYDRDGNPTTVASAARNMLTTLGNVQQPSEDAQPARVPGVGEARDNLQTAIVNYNGATSDDTKLIRARDMRDAALDLLHALREHFSPAQPEMLGPVPALHRISADAAEEFTFDADRMVMQGDPPEGYVTSRASMDLAHAVGWPSLVPHDLAEEHGIFIESGEFEKANPDALQLKLARKGDGEIRTGVRTFHNETMRGLPGPEIVRQIAAAFNRVDDDDKLYEVNDARDVDPPSEARRDTLLLSEILNFIGGDTPRGRALSRAIERLR